MHTQYPLVNQGCHRHIIEHAAEAAPQHQVVPPPDFVPESIHSGDGLRLVVSSQQKDVIRILYLPGNQEAYYFGAILPSVNVITHEEVSIFADFLDTIVFIIQFFLLVEILLGAIITVVSGAHAL